MESVPRTLGLIAILGLTTLFAGCDTDYSKDIVQHVTSPDGQIEAVVYETNGGATTSFGYEVDVRKAGDGSGVNVAQLYGAVRNEGAYGVNLRWAGPEALRVEYLRAKSIVRWQPTVAVYGKQVNIALDAGISDPTAPSGGMLHNLHQK